MWLLGLMRGNYFIYTVYVIFYHNTNIKLKQVKANALMEIHNRRVNMDGLTWQHIDEGGNFCPGVMIMFVQNQFILLLTKSIRHRRVNQWLSV